MTKCPRCANQKENYIQEGQNRCKVCFICWPIDEPVTPKDNPTTGQLISYGTITPVEKVIPKSGQILKSDGKGGRLWVEPPTKLLVRDEVVWRGHVYDCPCPACSKPTPATGIEPAQELDINYEGDKQRCKICNFTAQFYEHNIAFCSLTCRDRHNSEATKPQRILKAKPPTATEVALTEEAKKLAQKYWIKTTVNFSNIDLSGLVPKDEIWFVNPATLEVVGKITNIGEEKK